MSASPPSDKQSLQQLLVSFIYRPKQNISIWFVNLIKINIIVKIIIIVFIFEKYKIYMNMKNLNEIQKIEDPIVRDFSIMEILNYNISMFWKDKNSFIPSCDFY